MSDDRRVNKRYDWQVRDTASRTKDFYKVSNRRPVNIIACLQSGWILTDQGRKTLIYRICDDVEMGDNDGKTEFAEDCVVISVKKTVHEQARFGDGRSRMTLAHELAHGVMHKGAPKFRVGGAGGATGFSTSNALESAEHQAKVFASAFLVHDKQAVELNNPEEISTEFGISLEAARIVFERLRKEEDRAKSAAHVARVDEEIQQRFSASAAKPKFLDEPCVACGQKTVCIVGVKLLCLCGRLTDRLQDGDR
jgi:Zn-dependent peptidase ImmA (M78 family)